MRQFTDIKRELGLMKFVESSLGDLYYVPAAPGARRIIVRLFNRDLSPALVPAYAELLAATQGWVGRDTELAQVVRVEQPIEVGVDFIARPHYLGTSLMEFADDEDPPEPPEELPVMQSRFRMLASAAAEPRGRLIARVLARSILAPCAKTIYSFRESRFIIVDIHPTRVDLEAWAEQGNW